MTCPPIECLFMTSANVPSLCESDAQGILLIGDISKAFSDAEAVRQLPCKVHANMLDAIKAATRNKFRTIGIVMSGTSADLSAMLKALRDGSRDAKIILLAQMFEEPTARRLVSSAYNGKALADDYLICPVLFSSLVAHLSSPEPDMPQVQHNKNTGGRRRAETGASAADLPIQMKIEQLEKLATEDELTGLKNRRYLWEFCRQIIEHVTRVSGRVTLLIFDIDNLKHYNDVYGHAAGDEVLKQAAAVMRRCCRAHDVVGRVGGDEFAVVFWDEPQSKPVDVKTERRSAAGEHPREPVFIAERFRSEMNKTEFPSLGPEGKGVLTISGGLANLDRDITTVQQLFKQADEALLEAKRSGKDQIYLVGKPPSDITDVE
jgi:diguanylate cyclase (GGDEF)-like protein